MGLAWREAQTEGITGKEITIKRIRIEKPGLALFNRQKMPVGRPQFCL
jgi:hypothetical protein